MSVYREPAQRDPEEREELCETCGLPFVRRVIPDEASFAAYTVLFLTDPKTHPSVPDGRCPGPPRVEREGVLRAIARWLTLG